MCTSGSLSSPLYGDMEETAMYKRLIAAIILCIALFACSCSQAEADVGTFDRDYTSGDVKIDFDGKEFRIKFYEYYNLAENSIFAYREDTTFYDAALKRIREIENGLNCKITTINNSGADFEAEFSAKMISGLYFTDAVMSCSYNLRGSIRGLYFESVLPVSDILDYTDSEKWGRWNLLEQNVWNGELYGVCPVLWPDSFISNSYCFAFNEKFAQKYGQRDPREYLENGIWNRASFEELIGAYCFDDTEEKIYALSAYEGHFLDNALRANNAQTYQLVDGEYISGYYSDEGRNALEWAYGIICNYHDYLVPSTDDNGYCQTFIDERAAMLLSYSSYIYGSRANISYSIDEYCALPMPNGPAREKEGSSYSGLLECIKNDLLFPLHADVEASAYIFNRLFDSLEGFDESGLRSYYLKNYFHSESDLDVLVGTILNARYGFYADGLRTNIVERLYSAGTSVTQVLDKAEDIQNELVLKYCAPTAMYINDIFGDVQ